MSKCWFNNTARWVFILSGLLYGIAFMVPDYCWHQVISGLIIAFYATFLGPLSFLDGVIWVFFAYILPTIPIIMSALIMINAQYNFFALIVMFSFLIYWMMVGGVWIFLVNRLVWDHTLRRISAIQGVAVWGIGWIGYFIWISDFFLLPFLRLEGSLLWHPVILLAQEPLLLCSLPFLGIYWYTVLFVFGVGTSALFIRRYGTMVPLDGLLGIVAIVFLLILYWALFKNNSNTLSMKVPSVIISRFCASVPEGQHTFWINALQKEIDAIMPFLGDKGLMCTAEGAIDGVNIGSIGKKFFLDYGVSAKNIDLIFGTYGTMVGNRYGQLVWVSDGVIRDIYCKTHTLPFLEEIPHWCCFDVFMRVFNGGNEGIKASCNDRPLWRLAIGMIVTPYICSEFFFGTHLFGLSNNIVPLVVVNDSWLLYRYPRQLMRLFARMRAVWWQVGIFYMSPNEATYFDRYGNQYSIMML